MKKRKKPSRCEIIYKGEVFAVCATRHYRKIERVVAEHKKNHKKSDTYSLRCPYCKASLQWVIGVLGWIEGITFCRKCFPDEWLEQSVVSDFFLSIE